VGNLKKGPRGAWDWKMVDGRLGGFSKRKKTRLGKKLVKGEKGGLGEKNRKEGQ